MPGSFDGALSAKSGDDTHPFPSEAGSKAMDASETGGSTGDAGHAPYVIRLGGITDEGVPGKVN